MDAITMETAADFAGKMHIAGRSRAFNVTVHLDVQAGDKFGVGKLPHVKMMGLDHTGQRLYIGRDFVDGHTHGDSLEKNATSGLAEWNCTAEDDDCDDQ